jgi:predicted membrane protein
MFRIIPPLRRIHEEIINMLIGLLIGSIFASACLVFGYAVYRNSEGAGAWLAAIGGLSGAVLHVDHVRGPR